MKFKHRLGGGGEYILPAMAKIGGFSRVDGMVMAFLVVGLGVWFGWNLSGERGRTARCADNLIWLGKAMQSYANEHNDKLPAAQIQLPKASSSWDAKIFPYVMPGLAKTSDDRLFAKGERFFWCPSDSISHAGLARSYAMPANDMSPANWPPGPKSATGVGLRWDGNTVSALLGDGAAEKPDSLPGIERAHLPDPANTLLLTELIDPQNVLGSGNGATVQGLVQQQSHWRGQASTFHFGRFNYLMADGHVELLSALQTGSPDGQAGIWTIKKDD